MSERLIAIRLKIPDNEAYTALTALQRLGIELSALERSDIYRIDDDGDPSTLATRVQADESLFNPNVHVLTILESERPRPGETWIEELGTDGRHYVGWRLYDAQGRPAIPGIVEAAAQALLCNPAIERSL